MDTIRRLLEAMKSRQPQRGLVGVVAPTSAAGQVGNADAYNTYAVNEQSEGRPAMSRTDWLKQQQKGR
jgi:hypothetical protein